MLKEAKESMRVLSTDFSEHVISKDEKAYPLPSISFVIATYNSARTLESCLKSIREQDYSANKIEIIIVDGGSRDQTLDICKKYKVDRILGNPYRIEEKGIAIGVKYAKNEILGSIDADNVLPSKDWLLKVIAPFQNKKVVETEPLSYSYRAEDTKITRYVGLIGGDDPLAVYLGYYDRFCFFRGRWTDMPVKIEKELKDYTIVHLDEDSIPPIGANGAFFRMEALKKIMYDPFNHVDLIYRFLKGGYYDFAKVKIGIIHLQNRKMKDFILKKRRRIRRLMNNELSPIYKFNIDLTARLKLLRFIFSCLLIFPLLLDIRKGYVKKPDTAWFIHLIICPSILLIYATEIIEWFVRSKIR